MPGTDRPSQYVGPTEVVERRGKVLLFDAGAGEVIAEVSPEAAAAIRHHTPKRMIFDGQSLITEPEGADS